MLKEISKERLELLGKLKDDSKKESTTYATKKQIEYLCGEVLLDSFKNNIKEFLL